MLEKNKSVGFALLSIVLVLAAGLVVSGCGGGGFAPKPGKFYKVTFEASGGEPVPETQLIEAGSKIELPKTMERPKFTFSGWYKDPDCKEPWDFARDTVEGDIILFANWKSATGKSGGGGGGGGGNPGGWVVPSGGGTTYFTVNFDSNGGTTATRSVNNIASGTSVGARMPSSPENSGKTFFGWNTQDDRNGEPFTSKTAVTGSITVYAVWEQLPNRDGSDKQHAFLVSTPEALREVGQGNDGWDLGNLLYHPYYEMNDDIDIGGEDFDSIGTTTAPFMGVFDGNGHKIKNFKINTTGAMEGMFSRVGNAGCDPDLCKVTGVTLEDCVIDCGNAVAGMVGYNYGTVEFCNVIGCTINGDGIVGGVVGSNMAKVQNCFTASRVEGAGNVGGVVGSNNGTVQNCYATGDVIATGTASGDVAGGVVGYNAGGTVQNCYATGSVDAVISAGGVVGLNNATVQNCYATGSVTATGTGPNDAGGGVVGVNNSTVQNCYATGSVDAVIIAGGVVGRNTTTVKNCVALNTSVTGATVGRVAGNNTGTLTSNYANVASGTWSPGGINGANFTIGTLLSGVFNSSNGWSSSVWDIPSGYLDVGEPLPTLKNMPGGTQDPKLLALTP